MIKPIETRLPLVTAALISVLTSNGDEITVIPHNLGSHLLALDLSRDGSMVHGQYFDNYNTGATGFYWTAENGVTTLGNFLSFGVNHSGSILTGQDAETKQAQTYNIAIGEITNLPLQATGSSKDASSAGQFDASVAYAITADNQALGYLRDGDSISQAIWTGDGDVILSGSGNALRGSGIFKTFEDISWRDATEDGSRKAGTLSRELCLETEAGIFTFPAGESYAVNKMSSNGRFVVGFATQQKYTTFGNAFRIAIDSNGVPGAMEMLPESQSTKDGATLLSTAEGVLDNGTVVGSVYDGKNFRAVIWTPQGEMHYVDEIAEEQGFEVHNGTLKFGLGIAESKDSNETVILGHGASLPAGEGRPAFESDAVWILNLHTEVPKPNEPLNVSFERSADGGYRLTVNSEIDPAMRYVVQKSADLQSWEIIGEITDPQSNPSFDIGASNKAISPQGKNTSNTAEDQAYFRIKTLEQ